MPTIGELIRTVKDRQAVYTHIAAHSEMESDHVQMGAYEKHWENLLKLQPVHTEMKIVIHWTEPCTSNESGFWDVYGSMPGDNTPWAIEFVPWEQWLSMEVECKGNLTVEQMLGECFIEMTFAGFHQDQIISQLEEINEAADEVRAYLDSDEEELPAGWSSSKRDLLN